MPAYDKCLFSLVVNSAGPPNEAVRVSANSGYVTVGLEMLLVLSDSGSRLCLHDIGPDHLIQS
jgi:hypothetical protein